MKTVMKLAAFALPVLFAASCGGVDDIFGTQDGGAGNCPAGTTVYKVASGNYNATAANITAITDTCNATAVTAAQLAGARNVAVDANGTVTVKATDGTTTLGTGTLACNSAALAFQGVLLTGTCQYQSQRASTLTVTADNKVVLQYAETRSQFMSQGGTCMVPPGGTCSIAYTATMTNP